MIKKIVFAALVFSMIGASTFAQEFNGTKKGGLLGFSFNATDFATPNQIKQTSLKDVLKSSDWRKISNKDFGFSAMYWKGLTNNLDLSVRYNGIFSNYTKDSSTISSNAYTHELEASLHARMLSDNHFFNPFLTAGVGAGNYGKKIGGYVPLGVGLQLNLASESYFFLQANYRVSLTNAVVDNNLFYSFGVAGTIWPIKKAIPKSLPTPEPIVVKDRDNDGVVDSIDVCPDAAGLAALKGCPDADNDGIADKDDKCPNKAGTSKYNGCPIPDTDNDGINNEEDKCPTVAGLPRYGGCPIPDTDGDGVNDEIDKCPTVAGEASNAGCPVIKQDLIEKVNFAAKNILFATGSFKLLPQSFKRLDNVVEILKADETLKVDIEGYTDNTGIPEKNLILSDNRAKTVLNYFVIKGIDISRLTSKGFGQESPIADNKTTQGRTKNRRVELKLRNY